MELIQLKKEEEKKKIRHRVLSQYHHPMFLLSAVLCILGSLECNRDAYA